MPDNKPLLAAARGRADEFYTRYEDAERGLTPFRDAFRGADVLLDTNDGDWSAFWHFLSDRFDDWGLSRLRSLSFDPTADTLFASDDAGGRLYERTAAGVTERRLEGSGSFDSPEARAMAREADLTVGNPPFSLAGRYLSGHAGQGLLCLGPMTACSYSDVFPLFMAGRLHICSPNKGSMFFRVPGYKDLDRADAVHIEPDGVPAVGVKGVVWYTDLPGGCPTFTPTHAYDPTDNPFYDNLPHDIVEAGSAATVPADRKGLVGAPISLLANWPEGYRLVGMFPGHLPEGVPRVSPMIDEQADVPPPARREGLGHKVVDAPVQQTGDGPGVNPDGPLRLGPAAQLIHEPMEPVDGVAARHGLQPAFLRVPDAAPQNAARARRQPFAPVLAAQAAPKTQPYGVHFIRAVRDGAQPQDVRVLAVGRGDLRHVVPVGRLHADGLGDALEVFDVHCPTPFPIAPDPCVPEERNGRGWAHGPSPAVPVRRQQTTMTSAFSTSASR